MSRHSADTRSEPGAGLFVWGAWAALTLTSFAFLARFGTAVPVWDDFAIIPVLAGEQSVTPAWLWEQCNEHRIAIPKLILVAADRLAGNDIRAGMALSIFCLSAISAGLIFLAGRLRGGARTTDAVFPLLFLHPGHTANTLWSIQFAFVLPTVLGTAYLILIASRPSWPNAWTATLAGLGLACLPLCGGTGLMLVPPLACWLLAAAWAWARSNTDGAKPRAARIVLAIIPGLVLTALYFRGFQKGIHPETQGGLFDVARTALQFLTGGIGLPAASGWPWSGGALALLVILALALLGRTAALQPSERPRVLGFLAFLAGMLLMSLGVGWGRGWAGDRAGFQARYVTMAAPLWCWLALVFQVNAPPRLRGLMAGVLFSATCILLWPNTNDGLDQARHHADSVRALTQDIRAGMPPYRIIRRHTPFLHPSQDEAGRFLAMLRRAGIGPFRDLRGDPQFGEVVISGEPDELYLARWDPASSTAVVTGVDPQLTYRLEAPQTVAGLRFRYSHHNAQGGPARFQLTWKAPGQRDYDESHRYANWTLPTGENQQTTIWLDDTVTAFRIQPDNQPCEFRIDEIRLLIP